ncbi:hypothetical protein [Chitinivorax sp. B]|uniref:alpha-glutamyl/putrescinyl thymine pyrophosphorylase clade 3 protein n=1 Tax=Chitinivorax sp. B TaxID=2502235 RepID=UPI0010F741D2|nr:hypothetical protein [Chitinivorax sp. B]
MREKDIARAHQLEAALLSFHQENQALPGIVPVDNRLALVEQLLDSIRRVQYVQVIREKAHSPLRIDAASEMFDPLKAAAIHSAQGNAEEACWLVFLATHFGKHRSAGWRLVRDVYGALGTGRPWSWVRISADPNGLSQWLGANYQQLTGDGIPRHFGNHRKYETLRPTSEKGTGAVVASYVDWVQQYGSHQQLFQAAMDETGANSHTAFRWLYDSMSVLRFGRTAKFDYLTMLTKLQLAPIVADSAYLIGATGPLRGARLLFGGSTRAALTVPALDGWLVELAQVLEIGMQEMEDALCNWQKTPNQFVRFRG